MDSFAGRFAVDILYELLLKYWTSDREVSYCLTISRFTNLV